MVNTILARRVNHIVAKGDNPAWPKGAKSRGFSTMSQDAASELNGRFTALQIAGEVSKEQLVLLNVAANSLLQINQAGFDNTILQMVQINSYLDDIYTLQKKMFSQLYNKLDSIDRNTRNL